MKVNYLLQYLFKKQTHLNKFQNTVSIVNFYEEFESFIKIGSESKPNKKNRGW